MACEKLAYLKTPLPVIFLRHLKNPYQLSFRTQPVMCSINRPSPLRQNSQPRKTKTSSCSFVSRSEFSETRDCVPVEKEGMAGVVVVFDFDKTIIDVDSDNWVVDELGFTDLFNQLLPTMPWNSLMDRMMKELHSQGKTIEDIQEVLKRVPIHPRVVPAIKSAHALGCELRIVSDANLFFIETILEHLGLKDYFSEINTNPGYVDEEGRLRISPYHDFTQSSHGCSLCPPNMCKGLIIERIQASLSKEGSKKIVYLGDGSGDYCPTLKLTEADYVMPRKNFPVWDLISRNPMLIKPEIHEWTDGEELERVLLQLVSSISTDESNNNSSQLLAADCKLQTMSVANPEAFPQALSVRL